MEISLEGVNLEIKNAEIYFNNILVGKGGVIGPNSNIRRYICDIAEKHGLDAKKFKVLFRDYKKEALSLFKNYSIQDIDNLPPKEKSKVLLGTEQDFSFEKGDIEWLRNFSLDLIKEIKEKDDYDAIVKKAESLKPGGNLHEVLNEYEFKCYYSYGILRGLAGICTKALELGVNLRVVK